MREGWKYFCLGDLCYVLNGLWVGKREPLVKVAVIRNTNFSKDCCLKLDDIAFIDVEAKQFAERQLQYGDIIVEKSGGSDKQPVGRPVLFDLYDTGYSFSNFTATLRIKDCFDVEPKFVHYCLRKYYFSGETLKMQSKTTGLHNLNMKSYLRLSIPVPPLEVQERIVAELDLLTGVIEKQKAQLKELDNLAQSIFYDMFGDIESNDNGFRCCKLIEVVDSTCSLSYGIVQPGDDVEDGIPVVRPIDLKSTYVGLHGLKKTSVNISNSYKRTILQGNEILLCVRGTTGDLSITRPELKGCNTTRGIVPIRLCDMVETLYAYYLFKSNSLQKIIREKTYGATLKQINIKDVKDLPVVLPPLQLQQQFAEKIEAIEHQKTLIKKSIEETQKLFDYTMDKYFG